MDFLSYHLFVYTSPKKYSTARATITTNADIMKPCIIGLMPDFFISLKSVFIPIAAKAATIRNLLMSFSVLDTAEGIKPKLFIIATPTKASINQGRSPKILTFVFASPLVAACFFALM